MEMILKRQTQRRCQTGMTIIELLIAMAVLAVGLGGVLLLFTAAISGNSRSRMDTQAVQVSQTILEAFAAVPAGSTGNVKITDCAGNSQTVSTALSGSPLNAKGDIDWTKAQTPYYFLYYVSCGASGNRSTYEVRWQISSPYSGVKLINVSSRLKNAPSAMSRFFSIPATLHTMAGSY